MDVQDACPKPSWRQPSTNGAGRKAAGEEEESEQDSSDGEVEFLRLAQQLAENPSEETEKKLRESEARLRDKARQAAKRKRDLKAMLSAYKQKEREFVAQMDKHMDEVEKQENDLAKRTEALIAENQELRERTEQRAREVSVNQEKLSEMQKNCSESETRVQFLMERILALLNSSNADPVQISEVTESRRREREVLRQIEEVRQQFDEVRQQNGELTSRLTDEMSLSRRLSEQLAEVEERFFHHRPDRVPQGDAAAQIRAAGLLNSHQRLPDATPDLPQAEEPLPPLLNDRSLPGEPGRRTPLRAVPESEVPTGLDFDDLEEEGASQSLDVEGLPDVGMAPIAEDSPQQDNSSPSSDEGSRGPSTGSNQGRESREEPAPSRSSAGGARRLPYGPSVPKLMQSMEFMEGKLREALDRASFECSVVRVDTGVYNFGPSVRAVVKLTPESEVVASRQGGPEHFEPIDDFIRGVAQEGKRPPGTWMDKAGEDQGILGEPLPHGTLDGFLAGGVAEPAAPAAEREAAQAGHVSPPPQPVAVPAAPPAPATVPGAPARSPRTHWQPQAAAVAPNTSPPRGPATATAPPQRSSGGGRGPAHLGGSLRTSRQAQEPSTGGGGVQARTGSSSAPAVPPVQLHVASVMPMHGRAAASSTPERPRTGMPPPPAAPGTSLGAPLASPRPQASSQQKPATSRQLAPSPPRVVRGPGAGAPGQPARVAMTHSPRRQFAM